MASAKTAQPVVVSLSDLESGNIPFSTLISAFGPESLGILVVKDLPPSFASLRSRVLSNSSRLAALPPSTLSTLSKPAAKYLVGWSHGVETLKPGVVDTAKGSYYINCAFFQDPELQGADGTKFPGFEEYTAPNVWPEEPDVPNFRSAVEELIRLIIDTAILVARACDQYAESEISGYQRGYLEHVVRTSTTTKARLLHYFPREPEVSTSHANGVPARAASPAKEDKDGDEDEGEDDSWCATHLDHGCLTGLTSAMFLDEASSSPYSELSASPSPTSGLYIRSRSGRVYKVGIPRDCLAFQTGEALELITRGKFKAVAHFVRGVDPNDCDAGMRIARNTLAVFTQPNLDEPVDLETGTTFGEFARAVVGKNTAG